MDEKFREESGCINMRHVFATGGFLAQTTSLVQASVLRSATGMEMPGQNDGEDWCGGSLQNG